MLAQGAAQEGKQITLVLSLLPEETKGWLLISSTELSWGKKMCGANVEAKVGVCTMLYSFFFPHNEAAYLSLVIRMCEKNGMPN